MSKYELWLDESGDFIGEHQKRANGKQPSLIGGILIRTKDIGEINFNLLLDPQRNHANQLTDSDKKDYVLPILEKLRDEYHATEVFFENTLYEDGTSNRDLYLKMMAEGLLQLMQRLNAIHEDVELHVLIARRQDIQASHGQNAVIASSEYIVELQRCMGKKKRENRIFLSDGCKLSFDISIANQTQKLQLADFACNTRLTRNSAAFDQVKNRVNALYENAHLISMYEISSENYIRQCLARTMISDALMELYTTYSRIDHNENLDLIFSKIKKCSYRIVKSQLKQFLTDMIAYISIEDDYELGESLLIKINNTLIPRLLDMGENFEEFCTMLLLYLSDMFLREGDILNARSYLKICEENSGKLRKSLENLLLFYQIQEKFALYAIDSFQYEKAQCIMEETVKAFEYIIRGIQTNDYLSKIYKDCVSEYLGDALCMQIYAMMFIQRKNSELYDELCRLSDYAMKQYPTHEGELERHRQYRSHIELEKGDFHKAISYLMQAKQYVYKKPTLENIIAFLNEVTDTEVNISCQYYLMYYLLILERAEKGKAPIANVLYEALTKQRRLLIDVGVESTEIIATNSVNLTSIKEQTKGIHYHPLEIVYWKYGAYLKDADSNNRKKAREYMRKASDMCFRFDNYITMNITGIGVDAELIETLLEDNYIREANERKKKLAKRIENILATSIDSETKEFVKLLQEKLSQEKYAEVANMICY